MSDMTTKRTRLWSPDWWLATRSRMARAAAQTVILAGAANAGGWLKDWKQVGILALASALLSLANSVVIPPPEASSDASDV